MKTPSKKDLMNVFDISPKKADLIRELMLAAADEASRELSDIVESEPELKQTDIYVRNLYNNPYNSYMWSVTVALHGVNTLVDGHGVEPLGEVSMSGPPFEYINMGDPYMTTLIFNHEDNELFIGDWATVAESMSSDDKWAKNPAPFTKKGKRMMRAIEHQKGYGKRTPGVAAATVYTAAKRGVPGLVKKRWAKKHKYPVKNPISITIIKNEDDEYRVPGLDRTEAQAYYTDDKDDAIKTTRAIYGPDVKIKFRMRRNNPAGNEFQEGAARALWVDLYATQVAHLQEDGFEDLYNELAPGPNEDWMDYAPDTPEAAYTEARDFETALIKANKVSNLDAIIRRAASADGIEDIDEENFGYYTMMPALGYGVSWFDDHGDFTLRLPSWEAGTDLHNAMYDYLQSLKGEYEDTEENPYTDTNEKRCKVYDLSAARAFDPSMILPLEMLICKKGSNTVAVAIYEDYDPEVYTSRKALLEDHTIEQIRFPLSSYQWSAEDLEDLADELGDLKRVRDDDSLAAVELLAYATEPSRFP